MGQRKLTPAQWRQVKQTFQAAIELEANQRMAFLAEACAEDAIVRAEVESLLVGHERPGSFMDEPVSELATESTTVCQGQGLVGQALGHYQLVGLLGRGGMGEVYLAQDTRLKRKVALKLLPAAFTQDAERVRRFEQEARVASGLNHPNIITVHEIGEIEQTHYLVTEFVAGETLRQRLTRGRMEVPAALEVSVQVASALAAAHEAGIVHRDIKPENIMLRPDGLVKVLDFGLAKLTEPYAPEIDTQASTISGAGTESGVVKGTPRYMSPEQARGVKVDHRTDVFSLGVMVYELVAGRRPFEGETVSDVIAGILRAEPALLAQHAPEAPAKLQQIVSKALAKDREERYQTARDLLSELRSLKQEIESGTGGAVVERKLRPSVLTSRSLLVVAMLVTLMMAAVVYVLFFRGAPTAPPPEIKSLAVLPLKSIGGQAGDEYLGLGIADTIIAKVSQIGELRVRPTSAVRKYANQEIDSREAARQLQAEAVLELSVQRASDRLRVNVNLLRVSDGASLWSESFNVSFADIFAMQDEVSQQVARQLRFQLSPTEAVRLAKRYTSSPEAYEYYLKGLPSFDKGRAAVYSRTDIETAIAMFEKAVEVDPKYALARAQLAYAYTWMALHVDPGNMVWLERAKEESSQAQRLDPQLAEVHVVRSEILNSAYGGYQIEEAVREFRRAQQLNPGTLREQLASLYAHLGLEEPALREFQRAFEIDPTNEVTQVRLVQAYAELGRYDDAVAAHQRFFNRPGPSLAYLRKNQLGEAQKTIERELARDPNNPRTQGARALLLALQGKFQEAEAEIPVIMKRAQYDRAAHHYTYNIAAIYALQGQSQEAIVWLKKTAELGMPNYTLFARDTHLDKVRKEPAFIQFMNELKARQEGYQREFR